MAGETVITVVGNLTADPELRFTNSGVPFASFTIASTPRTFDRQSNEWKDGDALFLRGTVWREYAENVANTLTKGMRVVAQGRLVQRNYQDREGNNRTSYDLQIDEIGPSLRYATAQVTRTQSRGQVGGFGGGGSQQPQGQSSWGRPSGDNLGGAGGGNGQQSGAPQDNPWTNSGQGASGGGNDFGGGFDDEQPF